MTTSAPTCVYCGALATTGDHVIPRSSGGRRVGNLVPACADCNQSRGSFPVVSWIRALIRAAGDRTEARRLLIAEGLSPDGPPPREARQKRRRSAPVVTHRPRHKPRGPDWMGCHTCPAIVYFESGAATAVCVRCGAHCQRS